MPGFPDARRFILLHNASTDAFHWLQCVDDPHLAFVVIDTDRLDVDYPAKRIRRALADVDLSCDEAPVLLAICTVRPPPEQPLANLMAPVAVCPHCLRAAQIILHDVEYSSREPVFERLKA